MTAPKKLTFIIITIIIIIQRMVNPLKYRHIRGCGNYFYKKYLILEDFTYFVTVDVRIRLEIYRGNVQLDELGLHSTLVQAVCNHGTDVILSHSSPAMEAKYQSFGRLSIVNMGFH